jgi:para-nitrobenzyl esterase
VRVPQTIQAERKAQQTAPVYMYRFDWKTHTFGGKYKTGHNTELPFVFNNLENAPGFVGRPPDKGAVRVADLVSRAWATFARTGSPNHSGLPDWRPYAVEDRATMLFNETCETVGDPGKEERLAIRPLISRIL